MVSSLNEITQSGALIADQVRDAYEAGSCLSIVGAGSKAFYAPPRPDVNRVSLRSHSGVVSYEPSELVVTVRAGTPIKSVESMLGSRGQQFPFEPPVFTGSDTIGGMIACGLSGSRRPYAASVRDAMLGVQIVNGKGEILNFGGQVIKNVAGYDVSRLMAGSLGTLGVVLQASIKVVPKPAMEVTLVRELPSGADVYSALSDIRLFTPNVTGLACYEQRLYVRIAGSEPVISQCAARIGGDIDEDAERFWRALKDQRLPFFQGVASLWRVSLPPATGALALGDEQVLDWGGALRWIQSDRPAHSVMDTAAAAGGHAVLFRTPDTALERFPALSPPVLQLHQRIKHAFDPQGVFSSDYHGAEA